MTTTTIATFPNQEYEKRLRALVKDHRDLKDEPLLLAVYYAPKRESADIFLFEVIENFGGGSVDGDKKMFEVTYGDTPGFPMKAEQELHLVLTNPDELKTAVRERWTVVKELRDAFRKNHAMPLFQEGEKGRELLRLLHA